MDLKEGQGWTTHNPSIGSMLSLGIAKQNKNAGGNNVCNPGPGPKNKCVPKEGTNALTVGVGPGVPGLAYGWGVSPAPLGGDFVPTTINTFTANTVMYNADAGDPNGNFFTVEVNGSGVQQDDFSSISFINCDDNNVRTYNTRFATFTDAPGIPSGTWVWDASGGSGFTPTEEQAYWSAAVGKTLKVVIDDPTLPLSANVTGDYCICKNSDCNCRGPLGACPCRSK